MSAPFVAMLGYDFMRHAFAATLAVSLLAGVVGYLLMLRAASFAGHALSHIAFAGAAAALLAGLPPMTGLVVLPVVAGAAIGAVERRAGMRVSAGGAAGDVAIGLLLAASLALGLLCLHMASGSVASATSLLFGNVLGIDTATLRTLWVLALASLAVLAVLYRRLLMAILQPDLAEARGLKVRGLSVALMALTGLCVAGCSMITGVLLTFALLVAPPAAAQLLTRRPGAGIALSAALALTQCWAGLIAAYWTDWPASVWIVAAGVATWLGAWFASWLGGTRSRHG